MRVGVSCCTLSGVNWADCLSSGGSQLAVSKEKEEVADEDSVINRGMGNR